MSIKTVLGTGIAVMFILGVLPMSMLSLPTLLNEAEAHLNPLGTSGTGLTISLDKFRDIGGVLTAVADPLVNGETIFYKVTLAPAAGKPAYEGGLIEIKPDQVSAFTDVTPAGGVPCIGGTAADPDPFPCTVQVASVESTALAYTVDCLDGTGAIIPTIIATGSYSGGTFHQNSGDTPAGGAGGSIPLANDCAVLQTSLIKTPSVLSGPAPLSVTYTYDDTNTGNQDLSLVSALDNRCSTPTRVLPDPVGNGDDVFDPSETWRFTCTITYQAPADCGPQTNIATFTWRFNHPDPTQVSPIDVVETDTRTVTVICEDLTELIKTPSLLSGPAPLSVTYTYDDHNSGNSPLTPVSQTDNRCTPLVRGLDSPGNNDLVFEPSEHWIFTCTITYQAPADCGPQTNIATFTWASQTGGPDVVETDTETVTVNCEDLTELIKSASVLSGPAPLTVTYTYDDHNSGTAPLTPVSQTDNRCTPLVRGLDSPGNNDLVFEPSEHWIFTCTITYEDPADCGPQTNTATFTWASQTGGPNVVETDKETVRVICVVIGGEILPIDMTSLFVAGAFTNAFWILPVLGAIAGAVIAVTRFRREKGED